MKISKAVKVTLFAAAGELAAIAGVVGVGESIKNKAYKDAINSGHLDAEQVKKMDALVMWETKYNGINAVSQYTEFAKRFKAGETYEQISKKALDELTNIMKAIR